MTMLIIGATGNVGSHLVETLRQCDSPMIVAARDVTRTRAKLGLQYDYRHLHFQDSSTFVPSLEGIEQVYLVCPADLRDVPHTIGQFIQTAAAQGVEHVVFLSLLGVEHNRIVPHNRVERMIEDSGMDWTFLRASLFMQNFSKMHRDDIRLSGELFLPAGYGALNFIDVRDVADVAAQALLDNTHRNQAYELTGDAALTYTEVAAIFSDVLGRRIRYTNASSDQFVSALMWRGVPLQQTLSMNALYSTARMSMVEIATPQDTAGVLGHHPISLRQFIQDYRSVWL
jgi:uncharacterized protein YbjT (DUF2867 family)